MPKYVRLAALAGAAVALLGCATQTVTTTRAVTVEAPLATRVVIDQATLNLIGTQFRPLVPHCLAALEQGAIVSDASMALMGYAPTTLGDTTAYRKQSGGHTALTNTRFVVSENRCVFSLRDIRAVDAGGATLRHELEQRGYRLKGKTRQGFLFSKGTQNIVISGDFKRDYMDITLTKI